MSFTYTFGYSLPEWNYQIHYTGTLVHRVKVRMDTKTVAADYILSGINAVLDPNTMISVSVGPFKFSGINMKAKISFDPWAFIWNGFLRSLILEYT